MIFVSKLSCRLCRPVVHGIPRFGISRGGLEALRNLLLRALFEEEIDILTLPEHQRRSGDDSSATPVGIGRGRI